MPSIGNVSFNVRFDLTGAPKMILTDTTVGAPSGMIGVFTITQPDGYVRSSSLDTPDITSPGGTFQFNLSPDSIGGPQCGNYVIKFTVTASGYFATEFTRTFAFQYSPVSLSLVKNFDIFTPVLSYSDGTNYQVSGYNNTTPIRAWVGSSIPTGNLSSSGVSLNLEFNENYYDALYTISLTSTLTYTSQTNSWLTVLESLSKTETADACTPKPIGDLVQQLETFRNLYIECNGDFPEFEKAQTLFTHLVDMLRLLLVGGIGQQGVLDVYEDLLFVLNSGQTIPCVHTNAAIPPYDFTQYEIDPFTGEISYCTTLGNGSLLSFVVTHNLNDVCVVVQVYEVSSGIQVLAEVAVLTANTVQVSFASAPSNGQYRVVVLSGKKAIKGDTGATGPAGAQGLPGKTIVSDTPPANPYIGLQWYNSITGTSYIYYDNFWVQDANSGLIQTIDGITFDGGVPNSVYLQIQKIDAGNA
jgi:hypothetical protein